MVTAVAADDLEQIGIAIRLAVHEAGRLTPQNNRPVKPPLAKGRHAGLLLLSGDSPRCLWAVADVIVAHIRSESRALRSSVCSNRPGIWSPYQG
jgi:hypothetical protein